MIVCKALNEKSLYVSAKGEILPCCFIADGPKISTKLRELVKDPTYEALVDSWSSRYPHYACQRFCSEKNTTVDKK